MRWLPLRRRPDGGRPDPRRAPGARRARGADAALRAGWRRDTLYGGGYQSRDAAAQRAGPLRGHRRGWWWRQWLRAVRAQRLVERGCVRTPARDSPDAGRGRGLPRLLLDHARTGRGDRLGVGRADT